MPRITSHTHTLYHELTANYIHSSCPLEFQPYRQARTLSCGTRTASLPFTRASNGTGRARAAPEMCTTMVERRLGNAIFTGHHSYHRCLLSAARSHFPVLDQLGIHSTTFVSREGTVHCQNHLRDLLIDTPKAPRSHLQLQCEWPLPQDHHLPPSAQRCIGILIDDLEFGPPLALEITVTSPFSTRRIRSAAAVPGGAAANAEPAINTTNTAAHAPS